MQFLETLKYYKEIIYSGPEIMLPWSLKYKNLINKYIKLI